MKQFLASIFLLPFILAQAQDNDCPPGYEPVESPPGSGNIVCQKVEVVCPGINRNFVDPVTKIQLCCPTKQQLVIFDVLTRVGICCGVGQSYAGKAPNGKCCTTGQILVDGKCTNPPPSTGCESCPKQPLGTCALQAACGDSTTNGLQYGHCYQITFPGGGQLGRGIWGTTPAGTAGPVDQYIEGGYVQNIPYKICKTTTDCGNGPLANTDIFYIEDTVGPIANAGGVIGWDNSSSGTHMVIATDPAKAGKFQGKMGCSGCKCSVHLRGNTSGLGWACPSSEPGITFWPNPNIGLEMQFAEVPCNGDFTPFTVQE